MRIDRISIYSYRAATVIKSLIGISLCSAYDIARITESLDMEGGGFREEGHIDAKLAKPAVT